MTEWTTVAVREVADVFDGPHATPTKTDEGPWYLSISSLSNGRLDLARSAHLSEVDFPRWTKRVAPKPADTLFSYETRLGEAAFWERDVPAALGRRMGLLRPKQGKVEPRYLLYAYLGPQFQEVIRQETLAGATVDRIPIGEMPSWPILLPPLDVQRTILGIIGTIDDLIENNRRRVEVLKAMTRAIYREWFVNFRYPGHSDLPMIESALGPIPEGWEVDTVSSIAQDNRNSIAGGPFGSKLGRKDYQPSGVPVLRGANLRVGGGFDESDYVFISEEKATELRSACARRGDIVITQRGTLGQVGKIPAESKFDMYVLSQSQMKVTVHEGRAEPTFVYMQLCSTETTRRFVAQAITTGVPHVNLGLLREFPIMVPPLGLQLGFSEVTRPLFELSDIRERERSRLAEMRDRLLPRLVNGQLDVSTLDLDALLAEQVA